MGLLEALGQIGINIYQNTRLAVEELGRQLLLLWNAIYWALRRPYRLGELVRQLDFVGVQSVYLIFVTGAFTGMVLTLQGHTAMARYGAESVVGGAVALSLARELGPVLSALMVVGRAGSAMTAELGSMKNTDQIDALSSMAVQPVQYLVVPRIIATTLVLPVLSVIFEFAGLLGGYIVFTKQLALAGGVYTASVRHYIELEDITHGLTKAVVFGVILSVVSCSKGFYATGGARGVGLATTRGVIVSSLLILASDYVMTTLMFK